MRAARMGDTFDTMLMEIEAGGVIGIGERTSAQDRGLTTAIVGWMVEGVQGRSPAPCCCPGHSGAHSTRCGSLSAAGVRVSCIDPCGELPGRHIRDLLAGAGGADVGHFHVLRGERADAVAADAPTAVARWVSVLYLGAGGARRPTQPPSRRDARSHRRHGWTRPEAGRSMSRRVWRSRSAPMPPRMSNGWCLPPRSKCSPG